MRIIKGGPADKAGSKCDLNEESLSRSIQNVDKLLRPYGVVKR